MSKFKGKPKRSEMNEALQDVLKFPIWAIDGSNGTMDRGITKETCEHFGIRTFYSEVNQRVEAHYFPVTKKGKLSGFIKVSPNLSKKNGRFQTVGDVSVDCDLLGQSQSKQGKKLFIVEGVWDLATAWQALKEAYKDKTGKDISPCVVTFPLGIGDPTKGVTNSRQSISRNSLYVSRFSEVITCFDNDNPDNLEDVDNIGQLGVKDCAIVLKNFKNVVLPANDCNELYLDKGAEALYKELMFNAKPFELASISTKPSSKERLLTPLKKGVEIPFLPKLNRLMQGIREKELTILLAPPKCGKTTLLKAINYELIKAGEPTLGCYLEEGIEKTEQSIIALHAGVHLPAFRQNPSIADDTLVDEAIALMDSDVCMFFDDVEGKMKPSEVMPTFEWAVSKGAKYILFDHLSFVFSGDAGSGNERKDIDLLLTEMAAFVKKTGVHIIAVAHITIDKNRPKPKNQDGSIKYPYWYEVEEHDGRGSSAFAQVCWNMWAIDKEITEGLGRGKTRLKVLYNREWDNTGVADLLTVNPLTGRLQTVLPEEY